MPLSLSYSILKNRIQDGLWLGKDVLKVPPELSSLVGGATSPIISGLASIEEFRAFAELALSMPNISVKASLLTLETCYGINRAVNSKTRTNPTGWGNQILSRDLPSDNEVIAYSRAVETWNETLDVPFLNQNFQSLQQQFLQQFGNIKETARTQILQFQDEFGLPFIEENINTIRILADNASGREEGRLRNQLSRLRKLLNSLNPLDNTPIGETPSFDFDNYLASVSPRSAVNIFDVVGVVQQLATWFLSLFQVGSIIEALSYTVTSVVCKALNLSGARGCRYLAAGALKNLSLPAAVSSSGSLFAGAWATLFPYFAIIAVISILIIAALHHSKSTKLGNLIYIFGIKAPELAPDFGFSMVLEGNEGETRAYLGELVDKFLNEAGRSYQRVLLFVKREGDSPNFCTDYTDLYTPVPITDETQIEMLWNSLKPFLDEFDED
ncbi:hypothetical protein M595_1227 [Lyngbya aestuarii BL J]|uniref:Uncharacterized protein n=1 Tax=Lyngbya aestuarii BL J TaxID=1348334 RepID=U7QLK0_9CYAN|nr:hypothetical protein [Lyngbya aestuarii]ERT08763.1 hypothetical protein M595_1227 [Lyngbya aestuarii BL J]